VLPTHDNYRMLAASIIERAIKDRKKYVARRKGYGAREIAVFFASVWFEGLADMVGIDPDFIREQMGYTKCQ